MNSRNLNFALVNPEAVPLTLKAPYEEILGMAKQIAQDSVGTQAPDEWDKRQFAMLSAAEAETTVSIFGGRGSGKSTLLQFVCSRLLSDHKDLVLPIVRPEQFANRDTLSGWVLAAMQKVIKETYSKSVDPEIDDEEPTRFRDMLEHVRRDEALLQRGYGEALPTQNLTLAEFGRDAVHLNNIGAEFAGRWRDLVEHVLTVVFPSDKQDRPPLLVVPIDDADLRPDLLPNLILEIRRLAAHPQVAVLFCANEETTRNALISSYLMGTHRLSEMGVLFDRKFTTKEEVLDAVDKQFNKAFPSHLRVSLSPLEPDDRLLFKPIEEGPGMLLELLRQVPYDGLFLQNFGDLFAFESRLEGADTGTLCVPSPYARCLSPMPRELEHLYRQLQRLSEVNRGSNYPTAAITALVEHGMAEASTRIPARFARALSLRDRGGTTDVVFDISGIVTGQSVGIGCHIRTRQISGRTARIGVRESSGFYSIQEEPETKDATQEHAGGGRIPLSDGFTHTLWLAHQVATESSLLRFKGQSGRVMTPGGIAWNHYFTLQLDGEDTDDSFWLIPDWDNYYDYFLYAECWNRLVSSAPQLPLDECIKSDNLLEWFLLSHLELVCQIQKMRRVPEHLWRPDVHEMQQQLLDDQAWINERIRRQRLVSDLIAELYARSVANSYTGRIASMQERDSNIATWVDRHLIWAADPLCASPDMATWISQTREGAIKDAQKDLAERNRIAAQSLLSRLRPNFGKEWVEATISLMDRLDEEAASITRNELQRVRTIRGAEFKEELKQLADAGIPSELIQRMRAFGFTREIAAELLEANIPNDYVSALWQKFGKPEEKQGKSQGQGQMIITEGEQH